MHRVMRGATLRKTEMVPSVLCRIAYIDETSIALNRSGTVHPQRSASRLDPMCTARQPARVVATVNTIWISTSVIGSGSAVIASLLKILMPADDTRYEQHAPKSPTATIPAPSALGEGRIHSKVGGL